MLSENILIIDNEAFYGCKNINDLVLPSRIIKIGDFAFYGLKEVKTVNVPKTVEVIGKSAFRGCNSIEEITIPFVGRTISSNATESVFGYIFGCDWINGIGSESGFVNKQFGSLDGATWQYTYVYQGVMRSFYYYIPMSLTSVTITNQTNIPVAAFNGCNTLTDIIFERGIESQGEAAFQNCNATIHNEAE